MASRNGFFVVAVAAMAAGTAGAQSVVSVRSGLLNYSEGAVFINNQPVKQHAGSYPSLAEGSDLLTESGRAELLLTPNAWFRVGQNSAVRMVSNRLTDTKVALLYGSAMLDSTDAPENAAITLIYKDRQIRIRKPGKYRIDSEPAQFRVLRGTAEIDGGAAPVVLLADQMAPLDGATIVKRFTEGSDDLLDIWSDERRFIIASSLSSAQGITDPANSDDSQTADSDLGAYLGYIPPATIAPGPIAPLAGIYNPYPSGLLGLGYGSYAGAMFSPMYVYPGIYYGAHRFAVRQLGIGRPYTPIPLRTFSPARPVYGYRPGSSGYRPAGSISGYRPAGIGGRTPGIGIGISPRPVAGAGGIGARPAPHGAAHR